MGKKWRKEKKMKKKEEKECLDEEKENQRKNGWEREKAVRKIQKGKRWPKKNLYRTSNASWWPESMAKLLAERLEGKSAFQGTPVSSRILTTSAWPSLAACMSGLRPSPSKNETSAPESIKALSLAVSPFLAASQTWLLASPCPSLIFVKPRDFWLKKMTL